MTGRPFRRVIDDRVEIAVTLPQVFPLEKWFSYNNSGFVLLGRVIEVVTGSYHDAAMVELVFDPLGAHDTLLDRSAVLGRRYADGHYAGQINGRSAVAVQTPLWLPRSINPAGGIWSTTRDVLRYARGPGRLCRRPQDQSAASTSMRFTAGSPLGTGTEMARMPFS